MSTKTQRKFYLKVRHNPQFKKPYYVRYGQISKAAAKRREKPLYGEVVMLPFDTEAEYEARIAQLQSEGFNIQ
jgi:hypothetical protein